MIKRNISYHISEDRLDRAVYIMQTIGLGEIIKEERTVDTQGRVSWQCLTDTGVLLVLNEQKTIAMNITHYREHESMSAWIKSLRNAI